MKNKDYYEPRQKKVTLPWTTKMIHNQKLIMKTKMKKYIQDGVHGTYADLAKNFGSYKWAILQNRNTK